MGRIEDIEKEISKLRKEKEEIIKSNRRNKVSEYRSSIDIEKARRFYKEYNELCNRYDMTFKDVPYGYSSYESISRISDGKVICSISHLDKLLDLTDEQIEDIIF